MKNKTITTKPNIINKKQDRFFLKLALPCDRGFHWMKEISVLFFVCNFNVKIV